MANAHIFEIYQIDITAAFINMVHLGSKIACHIKYEIMTKSIRKEMHRALSSQQNPTSLQHREYFNTDHRISIITL